MRWSDERVRRKREEGGAGGKEGGKEGWRKHGGLASKILPLLSFLTQMVGTQLPIASTHICQTVN